MRDIGDGNPRRAISGLVDGEGERRKSCQRTNTKFLHIYPQHLVSSSPDPAGDAAVYIEL